MKNLYFCDYLPLDSLNQPIRSKGDIINILLIICKYINNFQKFNDVFSDKSKLIIHVDKMSRIFIQDEHKIYSFHFPFSIEIIDNVIEIYFHDILLDNETIYPILKFVENNSLEYNTFENMFDSFIDIMHDFDVTNDGFVNTCWSILLFLIHYEDAYIRYDMDAERENGKAHPLHHLDVYYTNAATFKIGLSSSLSYQEFADILNIKTESKFLE